MVNLIQYQDFTHDLRFNRKSKVGEFESLFKIQDS